MLRILGSPRRACDGFSRRDFLWAGGLSLLGVGLPDYLRLRAAAPGERQPRHGGFGQARACILLYLYGSPSQLELADPKPDAPPEIRGELGSIRSSLPGCDVCELLPSAARVMDRCTVVRSLTHPYPIHGVAYALTGAPHIDVPMELNPRDSRHWPFIGSVVDYLDRPGTRPRSVPANIALPWPFSSRRVGEVPRAGPYAAFLGGAYHPVWGEFVGDGNRAVTKTLRNESLTVNDPYVGVTPAGRFELASATRLPAELTLDRLDARRSLLRQFDDARRDLERTDAGRERDRFQQMAWSLIGSERLRIALDLEREPLPLRERYGLTVFGQGALAARRLVEAGAKFVSVFWDEYGLAGSAWDTHWDHYPRMKGELMPGLDRALAGLVADLDDRGLFEETLVLVLSEHGRTPKINNARGGGRDHWARAYTGIFAGGGVARGRVVGKTDRIGGDVTDRPVSPKDVLATVYHLLGIDPETTLVDRTGRPMPLLPEGQVVPEMLA
jgi:hypothetical protein